MSGAGLQGYIACGYGEETMRCYGTGLQGVIACGCGEYTPLLWVGAGLHGVGLHCLQQWRTHHAAVGGAGLQSYVAYGFGQVQSYGRQLQGQA